MKIEEQISNIQKLNLEQGQFGYTEELANWINSSEDFALIQKNKQAEDKPEFVIWLKGLQSKCIESAALRIIDLASKLKAANICSGYLFSSGDTENFEINFYMDKKLRNSIKAFFKKYLENDEYKNKTDKILLPAGFKAK